MPPQLVQDNAQEIRAKIAYNGEVLITYLNQDITLEKLHREVREICRFSHDQVFTIKWVDEEGDPCTISKQLELDEAIRLYEVNRDVELTIHVGLPLDSNSHRTYLAIRAQELNLGLRSL
ncbi:hypothetical protein HHI36_015032 [Cryptolaemus montrouzieri]|uniref:PB1 domain-containing protein n=1 Tax=Cryptolaemus montrouzieri TaxID=559131 RepID=A0ABD2N4E5_9CUCU